MTDHKKDIWQISTGELAKLFHLSVRRIQQLGQEGVLRQTDRNAWDGVWCSYAMGGAKCGANMTRSPSLLTQVALGWLSGVLIGASRPGDGDVAAWVGFCAKRDIDESSALQALGAARQIRGC